MSREEVLSKIRSALGRTDRPPVPAPPPVMLHSDDLPAADRVAQFTAALTALAGTVATVATLAEARAYVESALAGRSAIASRAPLLRDAAITSITGVSTEFSRELCASADVGITSADFALADTGTLVFLSESGESRLISLLPPCHICVIGVGKILSSLDALFEHVPRPAAQSSSMVLVTGPSRTADIEMRLVRGVHGPGEIHVVIVTGW